jgi:pimeloyl-ACP methyl ester carboxylesterase
VDDRLAAHETYTLDNHVEDIEALRQYLGLDKIVLLGVSYGGMVALTYATRYDHNLSHLILIVTAPSHLFIKRAQEILAERGAPEQTEDSGEAVGGRIREPGANARVLRGAGTDVLAEFRLGEGTRATSYLFT